MHRAIPSVAAPFLKAGLRFKGYRSRFLPTSVGVLHGMVARGRGTLPPVVVLHGLSACGAHYENLLRRLRPHVSRVLTLDLPGHGLSEAPPAALCQEQLRAGTFEALDQLLDAPAVLFGNSLGGAAAIRYAAHRPSRVRGLVLAAPAGAPLDAATFEAFRERLRMGSHAAALAFVDSLFHRPHRLRHLLALGIRGHFARRAVQELLDNVSPEGMLSPAELRSLRMPTVVLWGGADRVFRHGEREFFEAHLPPTARFLHVERYGHVPHLCHPDCLAQRIVDFCEEVRSAEPAAGDGHPATRPV